MPYEETWVKTYCDECKKANWICEGDMQDMTVSDTEAIECWSCGHKWWRDPDSVASGDKEIQEELQLLESLAEKGREKPC